LLTKWIDEGAAWSGAPQQPAFHFSFEPEFRWITVHGDAANFRELEGMKDGYSGGVKRFSLEDQVNPTDKLTLEGSYLSGGQDLQAKLGLKRNDVGFIDAGVEQWRKYYDNFGGFDPALSPPGAGSAGSLELDEGRAWVNLGLTVPDRPKILLGFEDHYRVGNESSLDWGVYNGKNIYPAIQTVNEHTDTIKLEITEDLAGWHMKDAAQIEFYRQKDRDNQPYGGVLPNTSVQVQDNYHQTQGMNTLTVEKPLFSWWSVSGGYYYSRLSGNESLDETTVNIMGFTPVGNFWHTPQVTFSSESEIFSVSSLFHPIPALSLSLESQNEWTHQDGFGTTYLDFGSPPTVPVPMIENGNYETVNTLQNASLRFTAIPFTIVSANARLSQQSVDEYEQDAGSFTDDNVSRKTDAENQTEDVRASFDTSPWRWLGLNAQYRYFSSDTDYNQLQDSTPLTGYPAFILGRTIKTDEVDARLVLKPSTWFRTTLSYQIARTDYSTLTDPVLGGISPGGPLLAGIYDAHTYAISTAVTPWRRLSVSGSFSRNDSKTTTFANNDPSIVSYKGNVYTASANVTYILNKTTDLSAAYLYGNANYGENNSAAGIPLGLDYTRHTLTLGLKKRINEHLSASAQYAFYTYTDPSLGGLTDYTAQGVFATLYYHW
jgi:hypothetical protein